jgi:signal transduction histidine kinase
VGRPFLEFTELADRSERARAFAALVEGSCPFIRQEVQYRTASGEPRWTEVYARLLFDARGNAIGTCGTLQDIHDRRIAQDRQEEARKYAETCNAAKNEFLSRVSHELRTPMNAIFGFAQVLDLDELPARQAQGIQHILRASRHLLTLLDELMDISRIESGKLVVNLAPVQLSARVGAAIELIRPDADRRRIAISFRQAEGELVLADDKRLTQVLLNLLSNAFKYNREGGSIEVWSERRDGNRIRTSVHDTGFGLTPDQILKVFQPFERLGAERTKVPGTGLGLSVAKHLTELMGGSMGVESEIDTGSTFWFELPECASGQPLDGGSQSPGKLERDGQRTVLYIDDSETNVHLVREILSRQSNARLITSETGSDGFAQACDALPDLVLLDLNLPDMTGWEVLARLRGNPVTEGIPVVVLTADVSPEVRLALDEDEHSVNGWLEKPLNVGLFVETVRRLLERCVLA